ncbi:MAG: ATP-binding protein, partial [Cellvibrionales bacterium]
AAKDEFVATVSHELRTPLHSIVATLDLLHTSATITDSGDKRYVVLARRGARALMQLIDELLDFQRLSQRELVIEQAPVHLQERLLETAEVGSVLFEESSIRFDYQINIPPDLVVETDIQRLSQVLMNLISNARKFTSRGEVAVVAELGEESDNHVDLHVRVVDTGIGMSPEIVERVGEAFYQGGGGLTRQHAGTGLGLGIVKGILEAMDSGLEIDSAPGAGSSFSFRLSLTKPKGAELVNPFAFPEPQGNLVGALQGPSSAAAPHRPAVLYVEDSETNRQVFKALLERFDVTLTLAESAKDGFALTRNQPFDLIVTDIQMPDYSGSDLLEWLRNDPGVNVGVPIVACTANASSQYREEYLDRGFAGVLVKPVTLDSLESFFAQHLNMPFSAANSAVV